MDRFVLLIQSPLWPLNMVTNLAVTRITVSMAAVIDQLRAKGQTVNEDDLAPGYSLISRSFWGPSIVNRSMRKCLPGYAETSTTALIRSQGSGLVLTQQIRSTFPGVRVSGRAIGRIQAT
jgi:hypothetical protein